MRSVLTRFVIGRKHVIVMYFILSNALDKYLAAKFVCTCNIHIYLLLLFVEIVDKYLAAEFIDTCSQIRLKKDDCDYDGKNRNVSICKD